MLLFSCVVYYLNILNSLYLWNFKLLYWGLRSYFSVFAPLPPHPTPSQSRELYLSTVDSLRFSSLLSYSFLLFFFPWSLTLLFCLFVCTGIPIYCILNILSYLVFSFCCSSKISSIPLLHWLKIFYWHIFGF